MPLRRGSCVSAIRGCLYHRSYSGQDSESSTTTKSVHIAFWMLLRGVFATHREKRAERGNRPTNYGNRNFQSLDNECVLLYTATDYANKCLEHSRECLGYKFRDPEGAPNNIQLYRITVKWRPNIPPTILETA